MKIDRLLKRKHTADCDRVRPTRSMLERIGRTLEFFYVSAIIIPVFFWISIYFIFSPLDFEYTKKALKSIWFLGVMIHLLNWIVAGMIKLTLDFKGVRTFEEVNGSRRLFKTSALLCIAHNKNLFYRYLIYYLVQFNYTSLVGFGSTIFGGLFVYIIINRV